jgi:ribosomal-protein-alanine N-acetyltransferase
MASTEPWITLRRDQAACEAALHRPGDELFIAQRGDARLGFILLRAGGVAGSPYIAAIAVAESARGQGVGTQLLEFAEQRFRDSRNLFLCVSDFNSGARSLYARLGYRQVGLLEDYVTEGHDELLMRKRLK